MAERNKHLFEFTANEIAHAAKAEFEYHEGRANYWKNELDAATVTVQATAAVKVTRVPVTGGWRPLVVVDYGDPAAYKQMELAAQKIQSHTTEAARFETDWTLYATQLGRIYALDSEDVAHFRLNGRPREE